jgi:energy-coupling factor transporter ATP-binding protein EcfA2
VLHLNGILRAGAGSVSVGGLPVAPATLREIRRRVGIVFQDPDDQLFMPTVGDDVAFGPANFGVTGPALRERVDAALAAVDMLAHATAPAASVRRAAPTGRAGHRARVPSGIRGSTNRRQPRPRRRELAEVLLGLGTSMLMVTHDLPYALQLCPRSVILDDGVIVADGPTRELLADPTLLARHRLELPFGFSLT